MRFGKQKERSKGIERKGTKEKPKSKEEAKELDKRRARNLFNRMVKDGMFPEDAEFTKPKSLRQAVILLKDSMNGSPEEAYKGLKRYVFNPNIKKQFTKKEICQYANFVKEDLGDVPAQDVNSIIKRKKLKCDIEQ